jgi:hypothetical protein
MVKLSTGFLLCAAFTICATTATASTTGSFAGAFGIIRIMPTDSSGTTDLDSVTLYQAMNVPVKDSMLGPGKLIEDAEKALQFICAIRNGSAYECAIFIKKSAHSSVNPVQGAMQFKVTGPDAEAFTKLYHTDVNGEFHFVSQEANFKVEIRPQYFEVLFNNTHSWTDAPSTLVIADVDDTLKITHSQSFWDSLNYVQDTSSRFMGMEDVFKILAAPPTQASFVYLAQPQELLAGRVQSEFLNLNHFPQGLVVHGRADDGVELRLQTLSNILKSQPTDRVILVGNNGGFDAEVFSRLVQQFPKIHFLTYVHVVYSTNADTEVGKTVLDGQTGYVTAVEMLLDLDQNQVVSLVSVRPLMNSLITRILVDTKTPAPGKDRAIPNFVNCENFYWKWDLTTVYSFAAPLKDYLADRCR